MSRINAHVTGSVWKIEVAAGARVAPGDVVVILESMKMELPVESTVTGTVEEVLVSEGGAVREGDALLTLASE